MPYRVCVKDNTSTLPEKIEFSVCTTIISGIGVVAGTRSTGATWFVNDALKDGTKKVCILRIAAVLSPYNQQKAWEAKREIGNIHLSSCRVEFRKRKWFQVLEQQLA